MKQLKLKNSDLLVALDDVDYEWAKDYEWVLEQKGNDSRVYRYPEANSPRTISLIREIAIRAKGYEFVDKYCKISPLHQNWLDLRRRNIVVSKNYKLDDQQKIFVLDKGFELEKDLVQTIEENYKDNPDIGSGLIKSVFLAMAVRMCDRHGLDLVKQSIDEAFHTKGEQT